VILIDSPYANIANIARALRECGGDVQLSTDPHEIARSTKIVLPGVGSFAAAMQWLRERGIDRAIRNAIAGGATLLGICVGHQLLFDVSHEMGTTEGLGLLRGEVRALRGPLPVPQIGWNRVTCARHPLFAGIADGTPFYFVHSYAVANADGEIGRTDYGDSFTAAVQRDRVLGVQFHPEKSSHAGLQLLRNFIAWN
jgi:glutamine amidotransferase